MELETLITATNSIYCGSIGTVNNKYQLSMQSIKRTIIVDNFSAITISGFNLETFSAKRLFVFCFLTGEGRFFKHRLDD